MQGCKPISPYSTSLDSYTDEVMAATIPMGAARDGSHLGPLVALLALTACLLAGVL